MGTIYSHLDKVKIKQKKIIISNLNDFLNISSKMCKSSNFIFRGVSSTNQIYPKLIRKEDLSLYEFDILSAFEKYYSLYEKADTYLDFLSLAQHYGLYTRLIDFSSNFLIAAFFALMNNNSDKSSCKIYVGDKQQYLNNDRNSLLNNLAIKNSKESFTEQFKNNMISLINHNAILIEPKYSNYRMFMQQGLFILPINICKQNIKRIFSEMPFLIIIKQEARKSIIDYLSKSGFTEYKLMPGLENVCNYINLSFVKENSNKQK